MSEKTIFVGALKSLQDELNPSESTELLSIGILICSLDEDGRYMNIVDMDSLLREESNILIKLKEILEDIEKEIPYFEDVFSKLTVLEKLSAPQLSRFLYDMKAINLNAMGYDKCFDLLINYNETLSRVGGEHISPETVNKLAISILSPQDGSFYNGAFGLGGGAVEAIRCAKENNGEVEIYGQEKDARTYALAKIRLFLSGGEHVKIATGDIFSTPNFRTGNSLERFDYVYMDIPKGLVANHDFTHDPFDRFLYGIPSQRNSDLAFISHALASLNRKGRAVLVVANGTLFKGGANVSIRNNMIASDVLEAVISLPARLYKNTAIPVNLMIFNKDKYAERRNKVFFINALECFTEGRGTERYISEEDINKIVRTVQSGREVEEFSKFVNIDKIKDGILLPSRYLTQSEMDIPEYGKVKFDLDNLSNIKTSPLKNMATFFSGYNVGSKNKESEKGKYQIVRISDVYDGKLHEAGIARYDIKNNARIEKYMLEKDDVILATRGTSLKVAIIPENDGDMLLSQNFIGIRCGTDLDPAFLKAYLESPLGQFSLKNKLSGTAIPTLSRKDVETLEIPDMSIKDQVTMMGEYFSKEKSIEQEIAKLERELADARSDLFDEMGISGVYEVEG